MSAFAGTWKVILTQSDVFPLESVFEITDLPNGNLSIRFDPNVPCLPEQNPLIATTDAGNLVSLSFAVSCVGGQYFKIRMLPPVLGRCNGIVQPLPPEAGAEMPEDDGGDPVGTWTAEEQGG